ncbi:MAG: CoA transferase [Chloroflexi bacterium]|nr:CoA transferase [Chloroflexota bacterium]MDA1240136.1 CoA transferase [Chloroflexota bacterium]
MAGPLDGVRILEFTQIIAGPLGCMLLADQGAEVMKVEPLGGEPWRVYAQFMPLESKTYQSLNRGKQSLTLDLTKPEAQKIVHRLVKDVDIVVSNYRPDVPARLGIDYETLKAIKPDLIYVDSTAFGRKGPWAMRPGYDIVAQGVSGFTATAGRFDENGNPVLPGGTATADFATGYAIAWGACAALYHRAMTGEGQLVETSLLVNALNFLGGSFMSLPAADELVRTAFLKDVAGARERGEGYAEIVKRRQARLSVAQLGNIYYRNYLTKDGAIAVGNLSASLRQKMRDVLGIDYDRRDHDPAYNPRDPETIEAGNALTARVEKMIVSEPTAHWVGLFEAAGVPVGELNFTEELDHHPQIIENEYIVHLDHDLSGPQSMVSPPHRMSATPPKPRSASPPLGRDTDAILAAAGYDAAAIAAFRAGSVIR